MKRFITLLLVLLGVVSFAGPIDDHGKLSVSGRKILNENSNEIVLRGMSMYWNRNDWPGGKYYTQGVVNTLAGSNWNSNVIRAAIGNGDLSQTKNFIDWAYSAGIYVIVDWHYHTLDLYNAKRFFGEIAKYAKDRNYSHVIYETFNEPCGGQSTCGNVAYTWTQIADYSKSVIDTIRTHDSDGIIVVGTPNYSSAIATPIASPISGTCRNGIPCAHNVMYSFHFYAAETGHGNYKHGLTNAWCKNLPVFITEWGTSKADGGKAAGGGAAIEQSMNDSWLSLIETLGYSWANWSVSDAGESSAALRHGASTNGGWSSNNLSPSGLYAQKLIKGRNGGGTLASVGLTAETIDCSLYDEYVDPERDGIARFETTHPFANYLTKSGADSAYLNNFWTLRNSSASFSASFNLIEVPKPGTYMIRFRGGSDGAGISWTGSNVLPGTANMPTTNSATTWQNSLSTITLTGESSSLNFAFSGGGANSTALVNFIIYTASEDDSLEYNIPADPVSALPSLKPQSFGFEIFGRDLVLNSGGTLKIYTLQGKRVALFNAEQGNRISVQGLPAGAYLAVLQKGGQVYKKAIYLK